MGLTRRDLLATGVGSVTALLSMPATKAQSDGALGAAGLWRYTSLGRTSGEEVTLDGLFVFLNGRFVQQALNLGNPMSAQMAQAHAGTFTIENGKIILHAEVGLIVNPTAATPVASTPNRRHELSPMRDANRLTLTFGSGTIQKFIRVGNAAGRIIPLSRGALALVDDHFLLVFEDDGRAISGSGKYSMTGTAIRFVPERWLVARNGKAAYSTAPVDATLEAAALKLPGETPLAVDRSRVGPRVDY